MKRLLGGIFFIVIVFTSLPSYSWRYDIHQYIYENALQELPRRERRFYKKLEKHWNKKIKPKEGISFAAWPDKIRHEKVDDLFARLGEKLPKDLQAFAGKNTTEWHYQNFNIYPPGAKQPHQCPRFHHGRLFEALGAFDSALRYRLDKDKQALMIAFVVHLIGDLHQPLHTTTLVSDCVSDRGGNRYCFDKYCEYSLHRYWDDAAGLKLEDDVLASNKPDSVDFTYLALEAWAREAGEYASLVYQTPRTQKPSASYGRKVQQVSALQINRASQRLSQYLRQVYRWQRR